MRYLRPLVLLPVLMALPAEAATVRPRTGDHEGFTRLVVDSLGADWSLGRNGGDYELRLDRTDVDFDLSGAFRLISRARIADLSGEGGRLRIALGCACHPEVFTTGAGAIVIDIKPGAPAEDSPYEKPLEGEVAEARPPASLPPERPRIPDPNLEFFWRGAAPTISSDRTQEAAEGAPARDDAVAGNEPQPEPPSPTPSISVEQMQAELLRQMSRAAAQGLLTVNKDAVPKRGDAPPASESAVAAMLQTMAGDERLPVRVETSIDRDTLAAHDREAMTADGALCLPDENFAIGEWGEDRPMPEQVAERRADLVGEFDRTKPEDALSLARLYIYFGFGAEARAVLSTFAVPEAEVGSVPALSYLVDGQPPGPGGPLARMTGCDTDAAMWAVLSWQELPRAVDLNTAAVTRTFSALPPHLRRGLGPDLSQRLLAAGADEAARAVRDAIARLPGETGPGLSLIDGQIALAEGRPMAGEKTLETLAEGNDPHSPEALVLAVRSQLGRGAAVDPALAESMAALAFERQNGADGPMLATLNVLARAASGDFDAAFAEVRRWTTKPPAATREDAMRQLFTMLVGKEEPVVLEQYFRNRDLFDLSGADTFLRLDLAARLMEAGFGAEVAHVMNAEAAATTKGRLLLGEAALADFDPTAARMHIAGLDSPEAAELRARAEAMAGDHAEASTSFAALGDTTEAGREAWRAGDRAMAAEVGPEQLRPALAALNALAGDEAPAGDTPGDGTKPIAAGRALLGSSQSLREALDSLLAATSDGRS